MPDFKGRQKELAALMGKEGLAMAVVSDCTDIFYYIGYRPAERALLILTPSGAKLFVGEIDNEAEDKAAAETVFCRKLVEVARHLSGRTGVDYGMPARSLMKLRRLAGKAKLVDAGKLIKEPRTAKDGEEMDSIERAVRLTKRTLAAASPWGKTEKDVAVRIEMEFLKAGAHKAYPTIVAAGKNSYYIHHVPGKGRVKGGPVIIDAGAKVDAYCADITRTLLRGGTDAQKKALEDVRNMQSEVIDFLEPGRRFGEVQKFWEGLMKRKGYRAMHAFGHGVGLEAHEQLDTIKAGSVLAVEPGVYIKGLGGFRVEDIVAVGKKKARVVG